MAHGNNFLATGYGSTRQWLAPFQLIDDTGTVMFAVASDGTLTVTNNQVVANPGNFKATGTGEIDGNFSIGDAFSGSPTLKVTAASGNTVISGTLAVTGATTLSALLDLSGIAASAAELKIAATSDTPTVAFTDNGGASHAPTTAPAGFLKVTVGAASRYIPFWA